MKSVKCDLCDAVAEGETFEQWMENLKPHYAAAHADFMKAKSEMSKEQQMTEMQKWMEDNKARFEAAE